MEKYPRNQNGEQIDDPQQKAQIKSFGSLVAGLYVREMEDYPKRVEEAIKQDKKKPRPDLTPPSATTGPNGRVVTLYMVGDSIVRETAYRTGNMSTYITEPDDPDEPDKPAGESVLLTRRDDGTTRTVLTLSDKSKEVTLRDDEGEIIRTYQE